MHPDMSLEHEHAMSGDRPSVVVFCGPSLDQSRARTLLPAGARVVGPAACGDVLRATWEKPQAIVLIDGYFEHTRAVWHKELLWALSRGIRVYGGSSMGALRAVELTPFGMIGVGKVFEQFASGTLEDDDEVAVVHESAELGYRPSSEAMVNIRHVLSCARTHAVIDETIESTLSALAKSTFYAERSWPRLFHDAAAAGCSAAAARALERWLTEQQPLPLKTVDALSLLEQVAGDLHMGAPPRLTAMFRFEYTNAWDAFVQEMHNRVI